MTPRLLANLTDALGGSGGRQRSGRFGPVGDEPALKLANRNPERVCESLWGAATASTVLASTSRTGALSLYGRFSAISRSAWQNCSSAIRRSRRRPYVWTKTADQILESIATYCTRVNDSGR